ncbi:MAG: PIN domain-containing protein [Egibacteraceae bacterium]
MIVALDSEALNALAGPDSPARRRIREAINAAVRIRRDVVVPTVVLAELCRGPRRTQLVDAVLAREERAVRCRDTDRHLARYVGAVLHASNADSNDMVDAHVVAITAEAGGGVILTGDPGDLTRLAAPYHSVVVAPLNG